jgi:hypothetical protein
VVALASPSPALARANEGAYAALEALLAAHAPTAFARYCEPCPEHRYSIAARRACPDCVKVERNGCETCRDEDGNPAKPEDCEVRKIIADSLTRTISTAEIDAATKPASGGRWDALKSDLAARIDSDIAVAESFAGTGTASAHLSLVSANRTTLAKMRELEGN